jgi:hypothetical protein
MHARLIVGATVILTNPNLGISGDTHGTEGVPGGREPGARYSEWKDSKGRSRDCFEMTTKKVQKRITEQASAKTATSLRLSEYAGCFGYHSLSFFPTHAPALLAKRFDWRARVLQIRNHFGFVRRPCVHGASAACTARVGRSWPACWRSWACRSAPIGVIGLRRWGCCWVLRARSGAGGIAPLASWCAEQLRPDC